MALDLGTQQALRLWHRALSDSVRRDAPDLSARQMAIMMTVYMDSGPHTVRGLSAGLNISKPAVTRALDRLGELDFVRRMKDPDDKRSVLLRPSVPGSVFLTDFAELIVKASKTSD
ncbi:MAG: MarR family transcriptional regulator [Alphaproteobacteria bacterium]